MEVPAFHGQGDEESAEVEKDRGINIIGGDVLAAGDAEEREEDEREE